MGYDPRIDYTKRRVAPRAKRVGLGAWYSVENAHRGVILASRMLGRTYGWRPRRVDNPYGTRQV